MKDYIRCFLINSTKLLVNECLNIKCNYYLVVNSCGIVCLILLSATISPIQSQDRTHNYDLKEQALRLNASDDTLFYDDFNNSDLLDYYYLYGSPLPLVNTNAGNPSPSFESNGDSRYASGAITKKKFDVSNGLIIESDLYVESGSSCHREGSFGLAKNPDNLNANGNQPDFVIELQYRFFHGGCWQGTGKGLLIFYFETESGERESYRLDTNEYLNSWNNFKIIIDNELFAHLYVNDTIVYTSENKVDVEKLNGKPLHLGRRSSRSGSVLHDNILITNFEQFPSTPETESKLLASYPFNSNANDESGNGYDGEVNSATLTTDRFGNPNSAYEFDGVESFIKLPSNVINEQTGSISIWFNLSNTFDSLEDNGQIFSSANFFSPSGTRLYLWVDPERDFGAAFISDNMGQVPITPNSWYHTVITWSETASNLYLNGVKIDSLPGGRPTAERVTIGSYGHGFDSYFEGKIDDVSIYKEVLTKEDVNQLFLEDGWTGGQGEGDLIASYPFNGNANDESGNGYDGEVIGASNATDRFGQQASALSFDGENDYVEIRDQNIFRAGSNKSFTWSFWIKPTTYNPENFIAFKGRDGSGGAYFDWGILFTEEGKIQFRYSKENISTQNRYETDQSLNLNKWHHVVISYKYTDGNSIKVFLNGEEVLGSWVNNDGTDIPYVSKENLRIGSRYIYTAESNFYTGLIDDFKIYDELLSESEIIELYTENGGTENQTPTVESQIPNQTAVVDASFSYSTQENTFSDPDNDVLSLTAELSDGSDLPSWLSFTDNSDGTGSFSGTPPSTGGLEIRVTATDTGGLSVSDIFNLTITEGGVSQSLDYGPFTFTAGTIRQTGDFTYELSGDVNLENILEFNGTVSVHTRELSIDGIGDVYLAGIPELETVTLYNGEYSFRLTEEDSRIINAEELLGDYSGFKVAGLEVEVKIIEVLDDGVRVEGSMKMPATFGGAQAEVNTIQVTKSSGLDVAGVVRADKLDIFPGTASIKDVELTFDSIEKTFTGVGTLETKLVTIGAGTEFIDGKVNSIAVEIEVGNPIPLGTTGLGLSGGNGSIAGLQKPPKSLELGVDIVPMAPGPVSDIVKLDNLSINYTFGDRNFGGSGALEVFKQKLSDSFISAQRTKIEFGGETSFADVLYGNAQLGLYQRGTAIDLNGSANASLQIPLKDGLPYDLLDAAIGLPYTFAETNNSFALDGIRGSADIRILTMDYSLLWEQGDFNTEFAVNWRSLNSILFGKSKLEGIRSKSIGTNRFEGQSLIVNPGDQTFRSKQNNAVSEVPFDLDIRQPFIIIRAEWSGAAEDVSIEIPAESEITPSNVDDIPDVEYYRNDEDGKTFIIIKNPSTGTYSVRSVTDRQYELDVIGSNVPPSLNFDIGNSTSKRQKSINTSSFVDVTWEANDPDNDATVAFYYDDDAKDFNGILIEDNLQENNLESTLTWDLTDISTGSYYIYAKISDGVNVPRYIYLDKEIIVTAENAPAPPTNLTATNNDSTLTLSWDRLTADQSYQIYYETGQEVDYNSRYFSVEDTNSVIIDSLFAPGKTYNFAISSVNSSGVQSTLSDPATLEYQSESLNNHPSIKEYDQHVKALVGENYSAMVNAQDLDGDNLSFSLTSQPNGMVIDDGGSINWTPTSEQIGVQNFKVFVSDQQASDSLSVSLTVADSTSSIGSLSFVNPAPDSYNSEYELVLKDLNLNNNKNVADSTTVTLSSVVGNEGIMLKLIENGVNSGTFRGTFKVSESMSNQSNSTILASTTDTLSASYMDSYPVGERVATAYFKGEVTSIEDDIDIEIPLEYTLEQNFPNPFNPTTLIRFNIPENSDVNLSVFSLLGQRVGTLVDEKKSAGSYTVSFDASGLSSGVYFYVLKTDQVKLTKKMTLIK